MPRLARVEIFVQKRSRRTGQPSVQALATVPDPDGPSRGFFADRCTKSSPMTMSSPLNGAEGLIGNSGRNTANPCETNTSEMSADTTAHFIRVAATAFTEVRTPFPG
jgi:hypothetical protein